MQLQDAPVAGHGGKFGGGHKLPAQPLRVLIVAFRLPTGAALGPAFADFAPGLNPFDWLTGIAGAVAIRLIIYQKSKKAQKYRRDEEYGSARWGTAPTSFPARPMWGNTTRASWWGKR